MNEHASAAYIVARRWETRLMITWIVFTFLSSMSALVAPQIATIAAITTIVAGLALYTAFSAYITPTYVVEGVGLRLFMALPPVMIAALFFGMLDRWMNRMGFGYVFRLCVTSVVFTLFAGPFVPASSAPLLVLGAFASAFWRGRSASPLAFLPSALTLVVAILLKYA